MIELLNDGEDLRLSIDLLIDELIYLSAIPEFVSVDLKIGYRNQLLSSQLLDKCNLMLKNCDLTICRDLTDSFRISNGKYQYYCWLLSNLPRGIEELHLTMTCRSNKLAELEAALEATNYYRFTNIANGLRARFITL